MDDILELSREVLTIDDDCFVCHLWRTKQSVYRILHGARYIYILFQYIVRRASGHGIQAGKARVWVGSVLFNIWDPSQYGIILALYLLIADAMSC